MVGTPQPKIACIKNKKYRSLLDKKVVVQARSPMAASQKIAIRLGCACAKVIKFQEITPDSKKKIYTYAFVNNKMKAVEKPVMPAPKK